jgi:hypothetical protein
VAAATTAYVLVLDADFLPDPALAPRLARALPAAAAATTTTMRVAWVVACFALADEAAAARPPRTVTELRAMVRASHVTLFSHKGHGATRPGALLATPLWAPTRTYGSGGGEEQQEGQEDGPLRTYEVCFQSQWEPYYVVSRDAPPYDERFTNQGGDKQQHALLLNTHGCGSACFLEADA